MDNSTSLERNYPDIVGYSSTPCGADSADGPPCRDNITEGNAYPFFDSEEAGR